MRPGHVLVLCILSCAGAPPAAVVGSTEHREGAKAETPAKSTYDLKTARAALSPLGPAHFISRGHADGRFRAELLANGPAREHMNDASGSFEVGATFLMAHVEARGDSTSGPTLMMEKKAKGFDAAHGDWLYRVIDQGGAVREEGALARCFMCHDDAPHDRVFQLPVRSGDE